MVVLLSKEVKKTMTQTQITTTPRVTVIDPRQPDKARLRVAAYARVSSDSTDQVDSYLAQVDFYTKHISSNEDWDMVDIYADEGLTGLDAQKRADFNRMIQDCRDGKIDRILCKSISRFSRNTVDQIRYIRELLRLGVSISFEKEHIDTGKLTSEQTAQIYGEFAQMESTNHSANMRHSVRMRMEKGLFVPSSTPYGYRLEELELVIVPEEADTVRRIYRAYLNGRGMSDIAEELDQLGIRQRSDRQRWHPSTIRYILTNISYTGDMLWQKTFATNTIPFRQVRNHGEKQSYLVEASHPAIISKKDFQKVQALMAARREQFTGPGSDTVQSIYRRRIICGACGAVCRRKVTKGKAYWVCHRHDAGKARCPVPQISEEEISAAVLRLYHKLKLDEGKLLGCVASQLRELRELELRSNRKIHDIDKEIAHIAEQDHVLVRLKSKGYVDPALYLSQKDELAHKLKTLRQLRRRTLEATSDDTQIKATDAILDYLAEGPLQRDTVTPDLFDALIKHITVTENGTLKLQLLNGVELAEPTERTVR